MSEETDVVMFILRRCAMMALELPSRSEATEKAASWITPSLATGGVAAVLTRLISRTAGMPAVTVKESLTVT